MTTAAGPQPVEGLDRLTALGERVLLVRGAADRELVALAGGAGRDVPDPVSSWAASQLRPDQVELLAGLPHPVTIGVGVRAQPPSPAVGDGRGRWPVCPAQPG